MSIARGLLESSGKSLGGGMVHRTGQACHRDWISPGAVATRCGAPGVVTAAPPSSCGHPQDCYPGISSHLHPRGRLALPGLLAWGSTFILIPNL